MWLEWGLILSVTSVSVTMLMIVSTFFAILEEAGQFYGVNRTMVLLMSNSFNIFYIIISPLMFRAFNKHYYPFVVASTMATGIASVGRYLAGTNYNLALTMTIIIAIAHIPIITAPYGLLKLFPSWQVGYAASIPLFLPTLGINFCILYGIQYITSDSEHQRSKQEVAGRINELNGIIAVVGVVSAIATILLLLKLKNRIVDDSKSEEPATQQSFISQTVDMYKKYSRTIICIVAWGSILGINWTYGALFSIIFSGQGLSGKETALIGLAANLSSALFSNLGTFLKSRVKTTHTRLISVLNMFGLIAATLITASKYLTILQNLWILIGLIVVLRAGYSSFVSLAFVEMEKSGIPSVIISGLFFWVANVANLLGMELVDLVDSDFSMALLTLSVVICVHFAAEAYIAHTKVIQPL